MFCTVHWADLIRLHFTSSYALYNYYVTNKETLNLVKAHKQQTEILITKNFLLQLLMCQISICAYSNCTIEIWEEDMTIAYHFSDIEMVLFLFVCLFLEFETLWLAITFFISMNILSYISFCDLQKMEEKKS